jgi:hypothetical protein
MAERAIRAILWRFRNRSAKIALLAIKRRRFGAPFASPRAFGQCFLTSDEAHYI